MQLISKETTFNFMGQRYIALGISALLLLVAIGSLAVRGLNFGLDFTGGTLIEVEFEQAPDLTAVRGSLAEAGFGDAVVQTFGAAQDLVVRMPSRGEEADAKVSNDVLTALRTVGSVEMRRVEFVGPQVGEELANDGGLAMLYALAGIFVYIFIRFQWKFSVSAVAALVHDVIITLGFFSLFAIEFDLTVLAALLAVIGYSLNDTIVVFDRVRENFHTLRKEQPTAIFNRSVNQMLSRTLMTSLTTLLVLIALFVFGGDIIHNFALALILGIVIGTYSSVYIAGTALLMMGVTKLDLMPVQKEGADVSSTP